jgi:FkbM family methyltransferase
MLSTRRKVQIARGLSAAITAGRRLCGRASDDVAVTRRGINWRLDLNEGIDLSIYLLGGFEVRTLRSYRQFVHEGDVVLDIGANIGAHTLPLAQLVGAAGRVIALEPTRWAFQKLSANVARNPALAPRVIARQMMVTDNVSGGMPPAIYSSWPLGGHDDLHEDHQGRLMPTEGAVSMTLDQLVEEQKLTRVDLIKLDVDGNEHAVLRGGAGTLRRFQPPVMLELAPYVHELTQEFASMLERLGSLGYELTGPSRDRALPHDPAGVRRR